MENYIKFVHFFFVCRCVKNHSDLPLALAVAVCCLVCKGNFVKLLESLTVILWCMLV